LLLIDSHTALNEPYTLLIECMNLDEAVELLRVVSAIPVKKSTKYPEIRIVRAIGEVMSKGYTLRIEKDLADADYRNHLNRIVESKNLAIRESERHLIIYRKSA
jgi:hypothetical protein